MKKVIDLLILFWDEFIVKRFKRKRKSVWDL